jgi:hypothetical protein
LAFCEGRKNSRSDTGDIDLLLKRSTDGGKTWGEPQVVWDDGPNTCGNPCPVVDETTGIIWLLLTHNPGDTSEAQIKEHKGSGTRTVWVSQSKDNGKTWVSPLDITASAKDPAWGWYATGPGVGLQIQHGPRRGRLVIPCDYSFQGADRAGRGPAVEGGSHVIYSDDHGQTWKLGGRVSPQMNECQVVELSGGEGGLLLNMRNTAKADRRAQSLSHDGGQTWTAPEYPPELVEPRCQASLLRYGWPSEKEPGRLLFSNPASPRRNDLTVRLSRDDGKTWPVSNTLHEGPAAYSCLAVLPDKTIGCLYECGRINAYEKITFARFPLAWLEETQQVLQLGSQRELFVDRFLIERMDGVQLKLHEPRREGVAVKFDQPWEGAFSCYTTVIKDEATYRMYYRGLPIATRDDSPMAVVCYAESKDGITWTKPNLSLFNIRGTQENNVVLTNAPFAHNFSPFLDERPDVPKAEHYKALAGDYKTGLHAFESADGVHWGPLQTEPVFTKGAFDSQNVAFWSTAEQLYICYFRTMKKVGGESYRWISRTTSKDFVHWTEPVEMDCGDTPPEHLYTNGTHPYYRAPQIYIALAKRFFPTKAAFAPDQAKALVSNAGYRVASSDSVFLTTRGGNRYDRTFMEAFLRPGPSAEDWVARDNTPALGVVPANAREMFIYRVSHYAQPTSHMARYALRTDGFVSVNAPYRGGELVTRPFVFSGSKLELNFETSAAGGVRVEIQDESGKPYPGYALADCPEFIGDEIDRVVAWSGGTGVASLAGKTVRLRFALKDADLYSLRFF